MNKQEHKNNYPERRKSLGKNFIIFLVFILIVGIILLTTFGDKISISGRAGGPINENESVSFSSELETPNIKLEGEYPEITIIGFEGSSLKVGGNEFFLEESENTIIITDFSGEINFNEESIYFLEGKASKIIINGLPIEKKRKQIKISVEEGMYYHSILFKEKVYIKEINDRLSGKIYFGEEIMNLKDEYLKISDFFGRVYAESGETELEGTALKIGITGSDRKIEISKPL